ncbi:MAG: HDOD domain-containing protein [Planctomycetes bacterium]|nr:HDOD domain-containing protein [Planctomycetota bacterium]
MSNDATDIARSRQVELILQQVDSLPTPSPVATRLLTITSSEDADLMEIGNLIEMDPSLATRILGMCRKSNTGLGDKITSVKRAVTMLGLDAVRSAVLSVDVYDLFSKQGSELDQRLANADPVAQELRQNAFDRVGFWKHALAVACCSQLIAEKQKHLNVSADEAFVAGLLHDLGKLVLDLVLPQSYARVIALAERRSLPSSQIEREVIGLDHHTAGKRMGTQWGLPAELQDVMWLHSAPASTIPEVPHRALIGIVSTAKAMCRELHLGWSGDFHSPTDPRRLAMQFEIDADVLAQIAAPLHEAVVDRFAILGLDDTTAPELLLQSLTAANRQLAHATAALTEKARNARIATDVLQAIEKFESQVDTSVGLTATLTHVSQSFNACLGEGVYAALFQLSPQEPWELLHYAANGSMSGATILTVPDGSERSLAKTLASAAPGTPLWSIAEWVLTSLGSSAQFSNLRRLRVMPLTRVGSSAISTPAAILYYADQIEHLQRIPTALINSFAAMVRAAGQTEKARLLAEKFVDVNRALVDAQKKLTESESLARLGQMTAGAAHEMNNPLTVISGRAQILAASITDATNKATATAIQDAAADLSELITSLNLIAAAPTPAIAVTTARKIVDQAIEIATTRLKRAPLLEVELPKSIELLSDASLISRALSEIIINAAEAAPDAGALLSVELAQGHVTFTLTDAGPGLSPKAQKHAFDPFFSEKPAGRQRGLGLARCKRLIESVGGSITLSSPPSGGTVARLSILRSLAKNQQAAA